MLNTGPESLKGPSKTSCSCASSKSSLWTGSTSTSQIRIDPKHMDIRWYLTGRTTEQQSFLSALVYSHLSLCSAPVVVRLSLVMNASSPLCLEGIGISGCLDWTFRYSDLELATPFLKLCCEYRSSDLPEVLGQHSCFTTCRDIHIQGILARRNSWIVLLLSFR